MNLQHLNPGPVNSTPALRITQSPSRGDDIRGFDFPWLVRQMEAHGRRQFGDSFVIHEKDHDVIRRLFAYFLADAPQAALLGMDLSKGILLTGPIGCGKTSLMTLMHLALMPGRHFTIKTCREVSFEFIEDGYEVIHRYSRMSFSDTGPRTYCFDDLGSEQALKYYGNECNVLAEIILSRYDHYIASDMITHITTNLSAPEIEDSYGPRVRSRMRGMFNLVSFDELLTDKRK